MIVFLGGIVGVEGDIYLFDGNFVGIVGMVEMLVQNYEGYVEFFFCLFDEWKEGSFKGLCICGGVEVVVEWMNVVINSVLLKVIVNQIFKVKFFQGKSYKVMLNGKEVVVNLDVKGLIIVDMKKNDLLEIR